MSVVQELQPGDLVTLDGVGSAVFISASHSPRYTGLALVIWKLDDGTWSIDNLRWGQYIGERQVSTPKERWNRIQEVFRA